jgi:hypothetical protein
MPRSIPSRHVYDHSALAPEELQMVEISPRKRSAVIPHLCEAGRGGAALPMQSAQSRGTGRAAVAGGVGGWGFPRT